MNSKFTELVESVGSDTNNETLRTMKIFSDPDDAVKVYSLQDISENIELHKDRFFKT